MGNCVTDERFEKLNAKYNFAKIKLNEQIKPLDFSDSKTKYDVIACLTNSFGGNDSVPEHMLDWMVANHLDTQEQKRGDIQTKAQYNKQRYEVFQFMMQFSLLQVKNRGFALHIKDSNNKIVASCAVTLPQQIKLGEPLLSDDVAMEIQFDTGVPAIFEDTEHVFNGKQKVFGDQQQEKWQEIMGDKEFMYINVIAVDPSEQGKGYGKQIMQQIIDIADKWSVSCYLECAGANEAFYNKQGFEKKENKTLKFAGCPDFDDQGGVLIMIRSK